jgi:chromosome segregation ATPase
VLTNQTIELEKERHDALRKAYDKQLAKMQEDVDGILAEDRAQMVKSNEESKQKIQAIQDQLDRDTKDMSDLQHSIFVNVEAAKVKEVADMDNVTAVHSSLQTYLHNMKSSLDESLTKQKAIEELAKSNQEALAAVTTKVDTAAFKLSMLEKKQASDHEQVDDKLKSLVETSDGLQSSLTTQTDAVSSLKETVDKFAQESPEFKKTVEGDHAALKSTIDDLMNEIKKADKLKQDISDLEISMNTQINDISSKIDDLGGTQSTLATSLGQQQTDMATLQTRIATLEESAKSSSDEAKSDHDRVSAVVTEMQSKLSTLLDLKTRIEELQASVSTNVEDLQGKITDAEATHNSTRDSVLESMENLKGELAAQALQEQNAESNTSVAIAQFQTELNDLNSFKADSEKSAAELVKKLTDTTESLSILDSKFSGQHTDLDSKISSLQASVDKVPTKVEFEKTIQDAMDKAKKAQKKLDEVGTEISNIHADQTVDDGRILSLNGKADEQSNTNDKNWKDILDMIQEEGDLFSKISKKLKDEELRKDVDTVFGRTSQPAAA